MPCYHATASSCCFRRHLLQAPPPCSSRSLPSRHVLCPRFVSQVELSTERGRAALLYDSTSQPLAKLEAGQRHDFAVKHDVKELVNTS